MNVHDGAFKPDGPGLLEDGAVDDRLVLTREPGSVVAGLSQVGPVL